MRKLIEQAEDLAVELDTLRSERLEALAEVATAEKICEDTENLLARLEDNLRDAKEHAEDVARKIDGVRQELENLETEFPVTAEELQSEFTEVVEDLRKQLADAEQDGVIE